MTARAAAKAVERAKDDYRRRALVEALRSAGPGPSVPVFTPAVHAPRCTSPTTCDCDFDRMAGE